MLRHKTNFNNSLKRLETIQNRFSNHNGMKLETVRNFGNS